MSNYRTVTEQLIFGEADAKENGNDLAIAAPGKVYAYSAVPVRNDLIAPERD